ncbi:MAG: hypothetical protein IIY43_08235, partial [Oscillospiraceae bacterium]|nr:hypothetical protein [Oscillospiraceae bacterium]
MGIQLALNTGAETTENGRRIIPIIVKSYEPNGNYEITTEEGKYTVISDDNDDSQFWFTVNGFLGEYDGYSHGIDSDSNGDYRVICFTKNELAIPQKLTTAELEKFLDENSENDVSFTEEGSYTGYYYILSNQGELFSGSKDVVITPKPATVIADAKSKSYGEPDPKLTYEAEGLVKTTNAEGIEMAEQLTGELSREPGENAGTYAIRLGNLQEANHNYALTFVGADLTITKADPEITLEPQAGKLVWTGAAQTLLTEGSAEGGTLQYALGNNASTAPTTGWGTSVPAAADAETYYVWYKVIGDSNHNDTAPVCITVTIDATGHTHKLTRTEAVAATCERDGTEAYWICSDCGKLFRDAGGKNEIETPVTIPATGHDWGEWVVTAPATETEDGQETRICGNDPSHTETRIIPALN